MNQMNRARGARWVMTFGTILEVDRSNPPARKTGSKHKQGKNNSQKEKNRD